MLSALATAYLFVGGSGAGALFASQVVDALWVKPSSAEVRSLGVAEQRPVDRVVSLSSLFGTTAIAFGIACLVFDLGRVDRALFLFLSPTMSFMTLGAFSLAVLFACAFALSVVRCAYVPWFPAPLLGLLRALTMAASLVVMAYTGLLLMSVRGVAFWGTALVPALFVASSLSCGLALMLVAASLAERNAQTSWLLRRIALCDAAIVTVELAVAVSFLFVSLSSDHPARVASAAALIDDYGIAWWGGFFVCGMIVPLAIEVAAIVRMLEPSWERESFPRTGVMLLVAAAVLAGGACMRAGVVESGQHRDLELQPVEAVASPDDVRAAVAPSSFAHGGIDDDQAREDGR